MTEQIRQLLAVIDAFLAADAIQEKTLSFRIFGDSKTIGFLRAGADITTGRLQKALDWMSEHWPEKTQWPKRTPRPRSKALAA